MDQYVIRIEEPLPDDALEESHSRDETLDEPSRGLFG
jgi:hypothetical protein